MELTEKKGGRYYLKEHYEVSYDGGTKARMDVELFLQEKGYKAIDLHLNKFIALRPLYVLMEIFKFLFGAPSKSVIFFQFFPFYGRFNILMIYFFFRMVRLLKGARLIPLVHDLNGIRIKDKKLLQKELHLLRLSGSIISLNEKMLQRISEMGVDRKMSTLKFWDYHIVENHIPKRLPERKIVYAGNLFKSNFIYRLHEIGGELKFNIYGLNYDDQKQTKTDYINYHGSHDPESIVNNLEGSFGLVWDGERIETCEGHYGEYLKLNTPHKASLYIAAELPIIIWKEAALAHLVEKHAIGIAVESLNDIPARLEAISVDEYNAMLANIRTLKEQLIKGHFIGAALDELAHA